MVVYKFLYNFKYTLTNIFKLFLTCFIMQFKYTKEQAARLIKLARQSIESEFDKNTKIEIPEGKEFRQARGVFVTLMTWPKKELRGCIGFPYPNLAVRDAVAEAAGCAAFSDPRFTSLNKTELNKIIIEISILTIPQEVKNVKDIEAGKDGLICQYLGYSGLLLPQVATEHKMNKIEFIEATCQKAGLPKDAWQNDKCKFQKFQAQIFCEAEPNGKVIEK